MDSRAKGVVIGIGGLLAGLVAAQAVEWSTAAKAGLAVAVAVSVSTAIWVLLRPRPADDET